MEKELIGHNKEIESKIFKKYAELRERGLCKDCVSVKRVNDGLPVSFFVIGEDFLKQEQRIMFVGKTVQDEWEDEPINNVSGFIDSRRYAKEQLFLPFWQCIKEICRNLWKTTDEESIWRKIAITDVVKCSTSEYKDTTPELLKNNCILNAGFFEQEVILTQPTHMILFVGSGYDKYLEDLDFGLKYKDLDRVEGGIKLWQRNFLENGQVKMRFLRTYHPGFFKRRKKEVRQNFCQLIADWIVNTPI